MSNITATCPVTSKEIFPLANAPSDRAGGGRHQWRPQQGTLTMVADADDTATDPKP